MIGTDLRSADEFGYQLKIGPPTLNHKRYLAAKRRLNQISILEKILMVQKCLNFGSTRSERSKRGVGVTNKVTYTS